MDKQLEPVCPCGKDNQLLPALHWKVHCQQVGRGDSFLSVQHCGETSGAPGLVLHSRENGHGLEKRHGFTETRLKKGH